jgi:hypothetical protein
MSRLFPSRRITRKTKTAVSTDNALLTSTIAVVSNEYGILWKVVISLDVGSETDLENLAPKLDIFIKFNTTTFWFQNVHPYLAHDDETHYFRHVDLGPWIIDFGEEGLYSGVKGQDIGITVSAAGTGIKTNVSYIYSGD